MVFVCWSVTTLIFFRRELFARQKKESVTLPENELFAVSKAVFLPNPDVNTKQNKQNNAENISTNDVPNETVTVTNSKIESENEDDSSLDGLDISPFSVQYDTDGVLREMDEELTRNVLYFSHTDDYVPAPSFENLQGACDVIATSASYAAADVTRKKKARETFRMLDETELLQKLRDERLGGQAEIVRRIDALEAEETEELAPGTEQATDEPKGIFDNV
jgi:hypothetical protein